VRPLALLLAASLAAGCGGDPRPRDRCAPTPIPGRTGSFRIGGMANLLAFGDGALWTLIEGRGRVTLRRIDPRSGRNSVVLTMPGRGDARLAVANGVAWISDPESSALTRVDLRTRRRTAVRPFGRGGEPTAVAVGADAVWVAANDSGRVARVDPETGRVTSLVAVGGPVVADVEAGARVVWASTAEGRRVARVDPPSLKVTAGSRLPGETLDVAVAGGALWVDLGERDAVQRLDPETGRPVGPPRPNGGSAFAIAAGLGSVWISKLRSRHRHPARRPHRPPRRDDPRRP
jgi:streptogramin lyase